MTLTKTPPRVRVQFEQEGDQWSAESEDAPGWLAIGATRAEVLQLAREGLPVFLGHEVLIEDEHSVALAESVGAFAVFGSANIALTMTTMFDWPALILAGDLSQGWSNECGSVDYKFPRIRESETV